MRGKQSYNLYPERERENDTSQHSGERERERKRDGEIDMLEKERDFMIKGFIEWKRRARIDIKGQTNT